MTTVAVKGKTMACDSQLSDGYSVCTRKVIKKNNCIVGWAGDWIAGEYFADYYLSNKEEKPDRDSDDDLELLVLKKSGLYLVDYRFREVRICGKHYAIGSGAQAAMVAMNMGATATEAVKEAIQVDRHSGGKVRSLSLG